VKPTRLLLLHPFGTNTRVWRQLIERLPPDFEVLAPTIAGHYGGPPVRGRLSLEYLADDIERQLDEAGWQDAHVVGNSLGGWLALELGQRGRARSVTAIAPAGGWKRWSLAELRIAAFFLTRMPIAFVAWPVVYRLLAVDWIRHIAVRDICYRGERIPLKDAQDTLRAVSRNRLFPGLAWAFVRDGSHAPVDGFTCPVRVLLCEHERVIPNPECSWRFRQSPTLTIETLPGVGHVPMLEDPDLVLAAIRRHIAEAEARPASAASG